jgi:ADP-heptose:LPS heptosyltransferase
MLWLDKTYDAYAQDTLNNLPGSRWLAIGPGCDAPEKVWPVERYCDLVERCSDLFDAVILVGGKGDINYADFVMKNLKHTCINLCGKTDLLQVSVIIKHTKMFIGNDSGLGHIASAVSTPTISLFGIGSPERYRPWGDQAKWIRGDESNIRNITVKQVENLLRSHMH